MRILVIAETAFGLFSALALLDSRAQDSDAKYLILGDFRGARTYYQRLSEIKLFTSISLIPLQQEKDAHLSLALLSESNQKQKKRSRLIHCGIPVDEIDMCDLLIFSTPTLLAYDVRACLLNEDGKSIIVDDGNGSHLAEMYAGAAFPDDIVRTSQLRSPHVSRMKRIAARVQRLLHLGAPPFNLHEVALFNPSKADRGRFNQKVSIVSLDITDSYQSMLGKVCLAPASVGYHDADAVFLTLPSDAPRNLLAAESHALEIAQQTFHKLIVRLHPRRTITGLGINQHVVVDKGESLWEALFITGTIPRHAVLIGFSSTAQFFPKNVCDVNQPLIVLNRLADTESEENRILSDALSAAESEYSKTPQLFLTPSSFEEFEKCCQEIVKAVSSKGNYYEVHLE